MRLTTGLLLQASQLVPAQLTYDFSRGRDSAALELHRRQDEYAPEFGTCGMGQTCAEACGNGFEKCDARDNSILFCYNPGVGQTCCPGGSGRACDIGFYCVNDPNGGQEYCCDEQSDLPQCASDLGISTVVTPATSSPSTTSRSTTTTTSSSSTTITSTSTTTTTTTTPKSSLQNPSASTATVTSSNIANSTTTRSTTSSIFTAEAPSASAIRAWGMGAAVVGWAVMI